MAHVPVVKDSATGKILNANVDSLLDVRSTIANVAKQVATEKAAAVQELLSQSVASVSTRVTANESAVAAVDGAAINAQLAAMQATIDALPTGGGQTLHVAQVRNAGVTANLNHGTTWQDIAIAGHEDEMDTDTFQASAGGVLVKVAGRVKITTHIGYTVAGARVNALVRAAVAGTGLPIEGKTGYVRNSGGHNESSATAIQFATVAANDVVTLQTIRESSASTSTPGDDGGCMILLEMMV